jgi:hypothetical protein
MAAGPSSLMNVEGSKRSTQSSQAVHHSPTINDDWGIRSMTSNSRNESLCLLGGYLGHIEDWDPECGDAFLMLNAREWLEDHLTDLTESEQEALAAGDERLLRLSKDAGEHDQTLDVEYLLETAKLVTVSRLPSKLAA